MMFIVSLIEFSKHVQNEISAKVMPKPQNFTADFADEMKLSKATVSRLARQMIGLKIRERQWRESFLPAPLVIVFATCLPLFLFKLEPVCSIMRSPVRDRNTFGLRGLPSFPVCITAHYRT